MTRRLTALGSKCLDRCAGKRNSRKTSSRQRKLAGFRFLTGMTRRLTGHDPAPDGARLQVLGSLRREAKFKENIEPPAQAGGFSFFDWNDPAPDGP